MKKITILLLALGIALYSCTVLKEVPPPVDPPVTLPDPPDDEGATPNYEAGNAAFRYWKHSPMHVRNFQPVNFQVDVADDNGIVKVELYLYEYELFREVNQIPAKRKSQDGVWGLVQTWSMEDAPTSLQLDYTYAAGFAPSSNVEYIFRIVNTDNEMTERLAMFDAGTSPWPEDKILLYATSRRPMMQTINLCFFPDIDFGSDWRLFLTETESLIYEGYHANNMIVNNKDAWAFYYTRQEADGAEMLAYPERESSFPRFMRDTVISGIDAYGLLHRDEYVDRTYFRSSFNFLASNVFTTEVYNYGTAVHETAHAVFRLSDEYDGCACFQSQRGANVFATAAECQAFNEEMNYSDPECNPIVGYNDQIWYVPEKNVLFPTEGKARTFNRLNGYPADSIQLFQNQKGLWYRAFLGNCIMHDDGDRRPNLFQRTCQHVIQQYYDELNQAVDPNDISLPPTILLGNVFGYEAVAMVKLEELDHENYSVEVLDVKYGVPTKNILSDRAMELEFRNRNDEVIHSIELDDPSQVLFHGKATELEDMKHGACVLAVPLQIDMAKATLTMKSPVGDNLENGRFAVKGIQKLSPKLEFSLTKKLEEKYLKFMKNGF